MSMSPVLALHICGGTLGFLSGCVAVSLRKGSRSHAVAGDIFVISMLTLASTGMFLALIKSQPPNFLGGALTFYLVATSWLTARHRPGETSMLDWVAVVFGLAVAAAEYTLAVAAEQSLTGHKYGYPPFAFAIFGSIALLAVAGDIRMLVRRGVSGTQRLARHLWRMNFAWFIASASIFLARPHLFPVILRKTGVLALLSFMPLILMVFWFARVKFSRAFKGNRQPANSGQNRPSVGREVSA
jgi:uncharacterized membrane protein